MKIVIRSVVKVVLYATLAFGVSSCTQKVTETQTSNSSSPTTVTVWGMGADAKIIEQLAIEFEKTHQDIQIKVQAIPWNAAHNKLLTAIASKSTPDMAQMGTSYMSELQNLGVFESLNSYLAKSSVKETDFIPSTLQTVKFNNVFYGLPWFAETRVIFYRKDLLAQAGYSEFPTTWAELLNASRQLKKNGVAIPFALIKNDINTPVEMLVTLWQNDTDVLSANNQSLVMTPPFKDAISYYLSYFKDGLSPLELNFDKVPLFVNGKLAMFMSGPWDVTTVNKAAGTEFANKWGVALMPYSKANTSYLGGADLVIFKDSPHKAAAYKFMEYLDSPAAQSELYKLTKNLPVVAATWNTPLMESNAVIQVFKQQLKDVKTPLNTPQAARIYSALGNEMEKMVYGKITLEEGLQELNQQVIEILKK